MEWGYKGMIYYNANLPDIVKFLVFLEVNDE